MPGGSLSLQEYTGDPKSPLLPPAITTREPNIDEMLDELPTLAISWFDELLSAVEEGMREAKEMMDEVADAIDDIKNDRPCERAGEGSQSAERKMRRYCRFAEKPLAR